MIRRKEEQKILRSKNEIEKEETKLRKIMTLTGTPTRDLLISGQVLSNWATKDKSRLLSLELMAAFKGSRANELSTMKHHYKPPASQINW